MHLHIIPLSLAGVGDVRAAGGLQLELATLFPGDMKLGLDVYSFKCSIQILVMFSLKEVCTWALIPMATLP